MSKSQILRHRYSAEIYNNLLTSGKSHEEALYALLENNWYGPDDSGDLWKAPHQWTNEEINELVIKEVGTDEIYARGYNILIKLWIPPESDDLLIRSEHEIANIPVTTTIGKILRMGRSAFGNPSRFPDGPLGTYGEWIIFRTGQRQIFEVNGVKIAYINDDRILGPIKDNDDIITGIQMEFPWSAQ